MFVKKFTLHLLTTLLCFSAALPEIIESPSIASVKHYVTDTETLVLFDIDNTIMEANEICATDKWFSAMVTYAQNNGYPGLDAVELVLTFFEPAMKKTSVHPVETAVSNLIATLQSNGNTVIALTSRSMPFLDCTPKQLASINIDFAKSPQCTKDITFSIKHPARFVNGILFCSNNDKGDVLLALFKTLTIKPKKIVFIDDKEKYLHSVGKIAQAANIPFVGIRYSNLDADVAKFALDEESKKLIQPKNPIKQQQTTVLSY